MKRSRIQNGRVGALRRPDAAARRPYLMAILNADLGASTFTPCASAHEVRPAYLELRQTGTDTYDVLWKVARLRRRLQQKLQFVTDDVAAPAEPTDAELADYLKTHADVFRVDRKFTFNQVYLDPS